MVSELAEAADYRWRYGRREKNEGMYSMSSFRLCKKGSVII